MGYLIRATYLPTSTTEDFGPWFTSDPSHVMFSSGFVSGVYAERYKDGYQPDHLQMELVPVVDEDNQVVGTIVAEASASVTHADGSTD